MFLSQKQNAENVPMTEKYSTYIKRKRSVVKATTLRFSHSLGD